jgi:hypothetical protein
MLNPILSNGMAIVIQFFFIIIKKEKKNEKILLCNDCERKSNFGPGIINQR